MSVFGFWSLQGQGGIDSARDGAADYFLGDSPPGPSRPLGGLFGVRWGDRPIAVGIMLDRGAVAGGRAQGGKRMARAAADVVRVLSRLGVHVVLPVSSPLLSAGEDDGTDPGGDAVGTRNRGGHLSAASRRGRPPTATDDMEDFFAPKNGTAAAGTKREHLGEENARAARVDESVPAAFLSEVLGGREEVASADGSSRPRLSPPSPTLLAGQMLDQSTPTGIAGGLAVMDLPPGCAWDEMASCLGVACDAILLVAADDGDVESLPGPCLAPTLRRSTPGTADNDATWRKWTERTCEDLVGVLRSSLVRGGEEEEEEGGEEASRRTEELFSLTTFVVPRGNAVSL